MNATRLFAMTAALCLGTAAIAQDPADSGIAPQPLNKALEEFADKSGLQVIYVAELAEGKDTAGAKANLSDIETLEQLLASTGLEYEFLNAKTVTVQAVVDEDEGSSDSGNARMAPRPVIIAQAPQRIQNAAEGEEKRNNQSSTSEETEDLKMEEIVVTGTRLRGLQPVGVNLITINREEIERTGAATVQDVIRALPQNFRGGVSDFLNGSTDRDSLSNTVAGNAPNLRGLGAGATLVLVNGRRIAPTGFEGIFTDITSIPLSAVERIEVLLDGASAIYGSDAVGGVVNIILRENYTGAETRLQAGTVTEGDAQEYQLGQSVGTGWSSGQAMLSYEFYRRESLLRDARALSADCDQRRFGGDNFCFSFSNPGTILAGGETFAIPSGQDGRALTQSDFIAATANFGNSNEGVGLLPQQERHSVAGFISQAIGGRLTLDASAFYSQRDAASHTSAPVEFLTVTSDHPFYVNPTGGTEPIFVLYSFRDDFGSSLVTNTDITTYQAALTGTLEVSRTWAVTTDVAYSHEQHDRINYGVVDQTALAVALADPDPDTVFNPFGDGSHTNPDTLDAINGASTSTGDSDLWTAGVTAEGPLLTLPGGEVRLALGAEYRQHDFGNSSARPGFPTQFEEYDRDLSAGFAELVIPLAGEGNRRRGLNRLELSLAGRYESYGDFGDTSNPKIGVEWSPVEGLAFSGSWGTSFRAPFALDLDESENISFIFPLPDPQSASGFSNTLVWVGGNADLKEETATTWNLGIDISPPMLPGLDVRLSYFDIEFEDRFEALFDTFSALLDPAFADAVTRTPTLEQREVVCSRSTFLGNPDDCVNLPIAAFVDARVANAAKVHNRGFDFLASYDLQTGMGTFNFDLNATYLTELARALRETSPLINILDTPFNPVDLRLRSSVTWQRNRLKATGYINYVDSYTDTRAQPNRKVDSWTTFDLAASYELPFEGTYVLSDTTLSVNIQNLFDEDPPFLNSNLGYDGANADLLGRFVSVQVRKSW